MCSEAGKTKEEGFSRRLKSLTGIPPIRFLMRNLAYSDEWKKRAAAKLEASDLPKQCLLAQDAILKPWSQDRDVHCQSIMYHPERIGSD